MALFVNREEQRTQLQEKLAADLQNKLVSNDIKADDTPQAMLEGDHKTRPAGMVIIVLLVLLVIVGVGIIIFKK